MKVAISAFLMVSILAVSLSHGDAIADLVVKGDSGNVTAQVELGGLYAKGQGVAKDEKVAAKWYLKAAEQGNLDGQLFLGSAYLRGRGLLRDSRESAKWYLMAAEQGNAMAQCQISRMHMTGAGVPKDDVQACKWSNLAAIQGDMTAKSLCVMLEKRMNPMQIQQAKELTRLHMESAKPALPAAEAEAEIAVPPLDPILPENLEPGAN